jgi:hypothetical protein
MTPFRPVPYDDHTETIPTGEAEDIQAVTDAVVRLLEQRRSRTGAVGRNVHLKGHGLAKGELRVRDGLPAELAQGVFAHPGRTYPAVARFSNGASSAGPDRGRDARGLAVRLFGVPGDRLTAGGPAVQDFVLINHPVFVAGTVLAYRRIERALVAADGRPVRMLAGLLIDGPNPFRWHWGELRRTLRLTGHRPVDPLAAAYFSMAPFRYGGYVAKFRVAPPPDGPPPTPLGRSPDAMRAALADALRRQEVTLVFEVQLRRDAAAMPVEDAAAEWPERLSPFEPVADLLFPRQEVDMPDRHAAAEGLTFSVWNAAADHRPLGGINRVRRAVYEASAAWRLAADGRSAVVPAGPDDLP